MIIDGEEILFDKAEDDYFFMYVPTRGMVAKIKRSDKEKIENNNINITKYFGDKEYIDISKINERERNVFPWLSINISDCCQLRCQYCYLNATNDTHGELMTYDKAKDIIDGYFLYIQKNYESEIKNGHTVWISFFGGAEPTYNFLVLKKAVAYIKERAKDENISVKLRITTNGYYSRETAIYIKEHFDNILLSFDGNKISQNMHRKVFDGKDSFDRVFDNAKIFFNGTSSFAIRMTVSSETIDFLKDSLDFFSINFPLVKLIIGKVSNVGRALDYDIGFIDKYDEKIEQLMDEYKDKLYFTALNKKKIENVHTCYCGVVQGKSLIISSDGIIKSCAHLDDLHEFEIGYFDGTNIVLDNDKICNLQNKYDVRNRKKCSECIAKYYCAGGCPANELYSPNDYDISCKVVKRIFINKLNEKINNHKKI